MILRNNNWVSVDEALQQLNVSDGIHEVMNYQFGFKIQTKSN